MKTVKWTVGFVNDLPQLNAGKIPADEWIFGANKQDNQKDIQRELDPDVGLG